jgi:hypothetical protein
MLATGGFRTGTLVKLQYKHLKTDLERNVIPIHVSVPAEISKGRYNSYYTYVNWEAAKYLTAYFNARRRGTGSRPPENIHDESPIIRCINRIHVRPISPVGLYDVIHNLYFKAGLIVENSSFNYDLRVHSIRKFFRTQLAFLGVDRDYIEYMMGHKISSYFDIRMKGIEHLRVIYLSSGISIRPQSEKNKIDSLKQIIRSWKLDPGKILSPEALGQSHSNLNEAR